MKNKRIGVIAGVIGFVVMYMVIKILFTPSFEESMEKLGKEINKGCPVMVDEFTQLDSVSVNKDNRTFKYHYTISGLDMEGTDMNSTYERMKKVLIDALKVSPELKVMKKNDVTFYYIYSSKEREKLLEITVGPSDYQIK